MSKSKPRRIDLSKVIKKENGKANFFNCEQNFWFKSLKIGIYYKN